MPRMRLSSNKVVAEIIDGEAIILDLRVGSYFATDGVGAIAWTAALDGWTAQQIATSASVFYAEYPTAHDDVAGLLAGFVDAGLLETGEGDESDTAGPMEIEWPPAYNTPILEKHDDLEDMMQLDPIHDTDASGWPMPAPKPR